ncbi:calcium channel, voltage-dependent, beta 1 subunit, isoform CRA_e [Rattus norvegicus]|uniref:Calcium channel, voltage-dependent, beta 1 subunit, isoform CRA_e n=1 Tax=Rattus norvegicus TaxID=10116 RepID=A6HIP7_RAT|nr:calcium channel, voltage-dependent, beta 1 subunit, isoform CRA_e [Rattus norvegicus]
MPVIFPRLPALLPLLLSWLLPGPLPLPGAFPSLPPFPILAISGPSQTEAEVDRARAPL